MALRTCTLSFTGPSGDETLKKRRLKELLG